jgi:uncharacterized membrane protein YeaQ/YmgE (transglycosylase-associated protein family)
MFEIFGAISFGRLTLDPGGIVLWILASLLAGWLAGKLVRGHGYGCLGDVLLGLTGSIVGLVVLSLLPLPISGTLAFWGTVVVAFFGALILAALGRLIGGGRRRRVVVVPPPTWTNRGPRP